MATDQEIARRENMAKIQELGFDPYPPELYPVNWMTDSFTTSDYEQSLQSILAGLPEVSDDQARRQMELILENRWNAEKLLDHPDNLLTTTPDGKPLSEYLEEIKKKAFLGKDDNTVVLAGRFMGQRGPFAQLQDQNGRIQLYLNKKNLGDTEEEQEKYGQLIKSLDIGDYIGIEGNLFVTGTGEVSVRVQKLVLLAKALRPLPIVKTDKDGNVHDAFTDPELRYRQRYVDLVVNPDVKQTFLVRSKVISTMRRYFDDQGWVEVETPILQPIHGGAAARPFVTHHNTLDMPLYLRIANELYLKRLVIGGIDGVYEIGKMFRNEGMDRTHNPEFTSMELYVAYKDYNWMMTMVEDLLATIATAVNGQTKVHMGENEIDYQGPYPRLTMYESIAKYGGIDVSEMSEEEIREVCKSKHIEVDTSMGRGKLIDELFGELAEPHLIQPTYITDYPLEMTPLAKKHRDNKDLVERFELFVNGKEIANAYTELNDPIDQRERFEEQLKLAERGDDEAMALDEDFLRAMEYGMPPMSGLGIGIDRLTMLMTDNSSIQEVIFFPQMRPEKS